MFFDKLNDEAQILLSHLLQCPPSRCNKHRKADTSNYLHTVFASGLGAVLLWALNCSVTTLAGAQQAAVMRETLH